MKLEEYIPLVEALLPAVLTAGRIEMAYFAAGVMVETKADTTPVTIADHEAEAVLTEGLHRAAPGIPVIAEEAVAAGRVPTTGHAFFLVDPLDGTRAFIKGSPEFTINIGLISDGVPVFGLIYAPALSSMYLTTTESESAYCYLPTNALVSSFSECRFERLRTRAPEPGALRALTSRSRPSEISDAFLQRAGVSDAQPTGSSLKFCLIAQGRADLYARFGPTNEWDTAAGQAILTAAGGAVVTMDGQALSYGKTETRFLNPQFIAWGRQPPQP